MLKLTSFNSHPLLSRGDNGVYSDMWVKGDTGDRTPTHRFIFGVSPLLLQVLGEIQASREPLLILPDFFECSINHLLTFLRCGSVDTCGEEEHFALRELLQLLDIDQQNKCTESDVIGVGDGNEAEMKSDPIKQEMVENDEYDGEFEMREMEDEPNHKPPVIMYSCLQCESCFNSSEYLNKHIRLKHKQGNLQCDQCAYITNNKGNFKRHVDTTHKKLLKFECDLCSKKFVEASQMEEHKNAVHLKLKSFVCETCGEAFAWKKLLSSHVKKTHLGEKPFCCGKCGIGFSSSRDLKRHEKHIHDGKS